MYRFFSSSAPGTAIPPPTNERFNFVTSLDAGLADKQKQNARRVFKRKRTTITLTVLLLVSQSPLLKKRELRELLRGGPNRRNDDDDDDSDKSSNDSDSREDREKNAAAVDFYQSTLMTSQLGNHVNDSAVGNVTPPSLLRSPSLPASPLRRSPSFGSALRAPQQHAVPQIVVGSNPVAATRFIRSTTGGESKIQMLCTVPAKATPDEVIAHIATDLRQYHRRLLHPPDYYVLHPAMEGQGALDRSRQPMHGSAGPVVDGMCPFPFQPLALVPSVFAAERVQIESKHEPQRRIVVYHERLLAAQHLGRLSQLFREMANLAHSTATQQWLEWRHLKNSEVNCRTGILARSIVWDEGVARGRIERENSDTLTALRTFSVDVQSFYDDCAFFFRRSNAAFEATRVIMTRARTECQQRAASRERWEHLVAFCNALWSNMQLYVRNWYTQSRLSVEIAMATQGAGQPQRVTTTKTARLSSLSPVVGLNDDELSPSTGDEDANGTNKNKKKMMMMSSDLLRDDDPLASIIRRCSRRESPPRKFAATTLLCTTPDSSLGATVHAVQVQRSRRLMRMALEKDALLNQSSFMNHRGSGLTPLFAASSVSSSSLSSLPSSRPLYRGALCSPGILCNDSLASTIVPDLSTTPSHRK